MTLIIRKSELCYSFYYIPIMNHQKKNSEGMIRYTTNYYGDLIMVADTISMGIPFKKRSLRFESLYYYQMDFFKKIG
jgi:hypothetical protein